MRGWRLCALGGQPAPRLDLHASMPNHSSDRRIGVNIQFVSTDVRRVKHDEDSAILVRGVDDYRHFKVDAPALRDMHPDDLARRDQLDARINDIYAAMEALDPEAAASLAVAG